MGDRETFYQPVIDQVVHAVTAYVQENGTWSSARQDFIVPIPWGVMDKVSSQDLVPELQSRLRSLYQGVEIRLDDAEIAVTREERR